MSRLTEVYIKTYRVYDAWEREILLETRDHDQACEVAKQWQNKRRHNEIEVLAVIDAGVS